MTIPLQDCFQLEPGMVVTYHRHDHCIVAGDDQLSEYRYLGMCDGIAVFGDVQGTPYSDHTAFGPAIRTRFPTARLITWQHQVPRMFRINTADDNIALV